MATNIMTHRVDFPSAGGGGTPRLWALRLFSEAWELNVSDLSVKVTHGQIAGGAVTRGMGGYDGQVWIGNDDDNTIEEHDPDDMSLVSSGASPGGRPRGVGGDVTQIWHCDSGTDRLYEIDPADFSVVRTASGMAIINPNGVGGDSTVIWQSDPDDVFKRDPSDFSVTTSVSPPPGNPDADRGGCGGYGAKCWYAGDYSGSHDPDEGEYFELDTNDLSIIQRRVSTENNAPDGIGGGP